MLYPERQITYLTTITRARTLPVAGRLLRRVGDHVTSDGLIAEADMASGYRLVELEQALGIPIANATKVMVKKIGDPVEAGEVIARTGALIKTECVSPVKGHILDARANRVLIEVAPRHITLTAFYPGQVASLIPDIGVTLRVTGALVQGVWGIGEERHARLECFVPDGNTPLPTHDITAVHMGTMLIGGRTLSREALERAIDNQVRAIIVGSIGSELIPLIQANSLSLMVTEGFGDLPMAAGTFALLRSYVGRDACFSPSSRTPWEVRKSEIVIPLPAKAEPAPVPKDGVLEVGSRVRALRSPYAGAQGQVVSLLPYRRRLESGILARGAEVDLQSIGKVFVPLENLEIIR
jgi:hypothetical protein